GCVPGDDHLAPIFRRVSGLRNMEDRVRLMRCGARRVAGEDGPGDRSLFHNPLFYLCPLGRTAGKEQDRKG
ncbi:MAG: hypothetical protein K2G23_07590, partial [Muribaculaceae bacterium]|nr:hypothetical protein [Muribaculaceae bacterium]